MLPNCIYLIVAIKLQLFFVSVGPDLADKIQKRRGSRLDPSTFLSGVTEVELIDKLSIDYYDIDTTLIKRIIPLTYICHLSFQTGAPPNENV